MRCRSRSACAGAPARREFVRPVHWLVMLFGREVVPATILGHARRRAARAATASMRRKPLRITRARRLRADAARVAAG